MICCCLVVLFFMGLGSIIPGENFVIRMKILLSSPLKVPLPLCWLLPDAFRKYLFYTLPNNHYKGLTLIHTYSVKVSFFEKAIKKLKQSSSSFKKSSHSLSKHQNKRKIVSNFVAFSQSFNFTESGRKLVDQISKYLIQWLFCFQILGFVSQACH